MNAGNINPNSPAVIVIKPTRYDSSIPKMNNFSIVPTIDIPTKFLNTTGILFESMFSNSEVRCTATNKNIIGGEYSNRSLKDLALYKIKNKPRYRNIKDILTFTFFKLIRMIIEAKHNSAPFI